MGPSANSDLARSEGIGGRDGLKSRGKTRIDLKNFAVQNPRMGQQAIPFQSGRKPVADCAAWLARARQARRLAMMLSERDAALLEAYADECEGEVWRLLAAKAAPIAA